MSDRRPPRKIEGARIYLEAREPSQAASLFALVDKNRAALKPWMSWEERTKAVADSAAFIEGMIEGWKLGEEFDYAIFDRASSRMIGSFGLHTIDWYNRSCHLGFWIDSESEGQGFVSEAVQLGEQLAKDLGFHRLVITCNRENLKSQKVALRNGYHREATMIDQAFEKGRWRDTIFFVKLLNPGEAAENLPAGYRISTISADDWQDLVGPKAVAIFSPAELALWPTSLSPKAAAEKTAESFGPLYLGVFSGEELVGWMWGLNSGAQGFCLIQAATVPAHRGRRLYGRLLEEFIARVTARGIDRISGVTLAANNAVLITMLKKDFRIESVEHDKTLGTLIHLCKR